MPGFYEESLADIGFNADYSGVVNMGTVVVLCEGTNPIKFLPIIFVLQSSLMEVFCLAVVSGGALGTRNLVYDPSCFFFRRAVFGAWHRAPKHRCRLVGCLKTFFCQRTRECFAGHLYVRITDVGVPAGLRTTLRLEVPMTTVLAVGHTTDEVARVDILLESSS